MSKTTSAKKPSAKTEATRWATCTSCEDVFDRVNAAEERGVTVRSIPKKTCPMCGMY